MASSSNPFIASRHSARAAALRNIWQLN